jgi:hypothetical protein
MTENIPDPPEEFISPPDEIVSRIADEMRGTSKPLSDEEQAALENARAHYRARMDIAEMQAAERWRQATEQRQREAEERQRAEATQRQQAEIAKRKAELARQSKERAAAQAAELERERLQRIERHAIAADQRRVAAEREFARRQWEANCNAIIDDILRFNNPPPEPIPVRIIDDYD